MKNKQIIALVGLLALLPLAAYAQQQLMPFQPSTTLTVSVSSSASTATLVPAPSNPSWQEMLTNGGTQLAFCKFGGSTVTATTSDTPIPAGVVEVFTLDQDQKYISCITSTSTTTVYATGGKGS